MNVAEPISELAHFYVTSKGNPVAEGVILPSGAFAISWFGTEHSHGTYPSLAVFQRIQAQMSGRKIVPGGDLAAGERANSVRARTFYLQRNEDWNGISGTGRVAVGFEFEQVAVLQWLGKDGSTFWYESVEMVERVHGHGGRTVIVRLADLGTTI
ncbi:MAG: hypothetical protein WBG63_02305 [Phormidesmis sp.]